MPTLNLDEPTKLTCQRCHHTWYPRNPAKLPKTCPSCNSRYWQTPLTSYWAAIRKANQDKRNKLNG